MAFTFEKATRHKALLRMALSGPSGAGKSYSALLIAKGLGGPIAAIDTERGSIRLYDHLVDFDVLELAPPFSPERYIEAIQAAEKHLGPGGTLIIDSTTHEWKGQGGVLEIVDMLARANRGNSFNAWDQATPRHQKFVDAILQCNLHVIVTMRAKSAYVQSQGANGKTKIEKLGMAPEQRDGFEFEFTAVLDLVNDQNIATSSKDRTGLFRDPQVITEDTGRRLLTWLNKGAEAPKTPAPNRAEQAAQPPAADPPPPPDAKTVARNGLWATVYEKGEELGLSKDEATAGLRDILQAEYGTDSTKVRTPEELRFVTDRIKANPQVLRKAVAGEPQDDDDIPPWTNDPPPVTDGTREIDGETGEVVKDKDPFGDPELSAEVAKFFAKLSDVDRIRAVTKLAFRLFNVKAFNDLTADQRGQLTADLRTNPDKIRALLSPKAS